jgi:hypothetical protein
MARPNLQLRLAHSRGLRYGFAATSCAMALGVALLAHRYDFLNMEAPLFLLAICPHRLVHGDWACDSCSCTFKFSPSTTFLPNPATRTRSEGDSNISTSTRATTKVISISGVVVLWKTRTRRAPK